MKTINGLYAIIDTTFSPQYSHEELAEMCLAGGCRLIQLRIKSKGDSQNKLWSDDAFKAAAKIMRLKKNFDFTFIVNDYVDVAGEVKADGVHVGANDISIADARKRIGRDVIVGYSSHSLEEAKRAEGEGADYIAFGAIFRSVTKGPGHPVQGIEKLKNLVKEVKKPIVAIGGIHRGNITEVCSARPASIAMITALTRAPNVADEVKWFIKMLKKS